MTTLGYAVLGLLAERPHTGYEVARRMDRPIGYFWTARHSQIYPELSRLEAAGHVRHRVVDGPGPRDTKRYRITPAGRAALRAWVDAPLAPQPGRSELLLRVRTLWLLDPARATAFLRRVREEHAQALAGYRREESTFDADEVARGLSSPTFGAWATLQHGIGYEQHVVAWCDAVLAAAGSGPDDGLGTEGHGTGDDEGPVTG